MLQMNWTLVPHEHVVRFEMKNGEMAQWLAGLSIVLPKNTKSSQ